jgi:glycosyltransferase involved in cell wall biosynthesis
MITGKPVVVSSCPPLRRIVEETGAGLVFRANDSGSLAGQLLYMYKNPERMKEMGECGRAAALGPYSWTHDARRLVDMYAGIGATIS